MPALSFWTVFLAEVNFRQQEGKEQTCPCDSQKHLQSSVQFEGYFFSSVSSKLKSLLFSGISRALQSAGNGSRTVPGLPGGAKPWDGRGAAGGSSAARSAAARGAESFGAGTVKDYE